MTADLTPPTGTPHHKTRYTPDELLKLKGYPPLTRRFKIARWLRLNTDELVSFGLIALGVMGIAASIAFIILVLAIGVWLWPVNPWWSIGWFVIWFFMRSRIHIHIGKDK